MTDFFKLDVQEQASRLEAAGRVALRHWNLEDATLSLIKHRENAVFKVENDGRRAALRLHRLGYHSDAALKSELQWMQALAQAGVKVPELVPTKSAHFFAKQAVQGMPEEIQIDLFEWVEGEQLGSVEEGLADESKVADIYGAIGELAARVHNQAVGWQLPDGFERHAWDAEGLAGDNPFWGRFWKLEAATPAQTELLKRGRDRVFDELSQLPKSPGNYSMIHADFVSENLLVNGNDVRLIDFDDAGFGWHLFEFATSLYFILDEPYFETARDALFAGYRKHRQLSDEDLEKMPLFFLARGFTYIGWVHTRQETETARELTPMLLDAACGLAEDYLSN